MDVELLTMKNFEVYIPVDVGFSTLSEPKNTQASFTTGRQHMASYCPPTADTFVFNPFKPEFTIVIFIH